MTIAACYVSPEGIVLGADSTTTFGLSNGNHYFNHAQKLFEIGEKSTLGIVTWGLGGIGSISYRRLIAELANAMRAAPPANVADAAQAWIDLFWPTYDKSQAIQFFRVLAAKQPFVPGGVADPATRTEGEEKQLSSLSQDLIVGFCLAGHVAPNHEPAAYQIIFAPGSPKPTATPITVGNFSFWGAPNMIKRLIFGYDDSLRSEILASTHWSGTPADLDAMLAQQQLSHGNIPIRDAIDFVQSCISSTNKALKFSHYSQICGGPIEIAVVTADRSFRWVRHKAWDSAISEGEP